MKKEESNYHQFSSITDAHRAFGLPKPLHPLISLINGANTPDHVVAPTGSHVLNFYKISYKPQLSGKLKYGQHHYDFDGGGLLFAAPRQIIGNYPDDDTQAATCSLYTLLIHPDFLQGYPIIQKMKQYGFFSYTANEALHLSDHEKETIISLFKMIETELNSRIDDFSQDVIISQIELLLNFANRFYKRQFITRKVVSNDLLQKLENILEEHFSQKQSIARGLPTVALLAEQLNMSSSYLSDMLRSLTGRNAQQHIHDKLIEKAKEVLSTTSLSVSEVAYSLGFEYAQSFSKLFKTKTNLSPLEFRQQFN
ncbi:AraC family transcriptional regulator [Mucilaginibacter sp. CSA2-8R]|uniref:helix-turn-helix domain-containing protein n=1 Tax=Mucilaginibacter sp. CSA2-8R TaxID=3141542 RepID=UPI00315C98EB